MPNNTQKLGNLVNGLYVNSAGNVGIGTSSPNVSGQSSNIRVLTVQGIGGSYGGYEAGATGNPYDGALQGFYAFTNTSITGGITSYIGSWLSGTGGSTIGSDLRFYVKQNGSSQIEGMRITNTGNVGIGTTSADAPLTVYGNIYAGYGGPASNRGIYFGNSGYQASILYNNSTGHLEISPRSGFNTIVNNGRFIVKSEGIVSQKGMNNSVGAGSFLGMQDTSGSEYWYLMQLNTSAGMDFWSFTGSWNVRATLSSGGVWSSVGGGTSDRRKKQNIEYIESSGLDAISLLKPTKFEFISCPDKTRRGFIAQDVLEVIPDLVLGDGEKEDGVYGLDYDGILALAVKAIQELKAEIDILKNK